MWNIALKTTETDLKFQIVVSACLHLKLGSLFRTILKAARAHTHAILSAISNILTSVSTSTPSAFEVISIMQLTH